MLFEDYGEEIGNPIPYQREKTAKDIKEVVPAPESAGCINERADDGPKPAWETLQIVS